MRMVVPGTSSSTSGYIPSSVYLRSSYRTKQYPTLSTIAPSGSTTRTLSIVGAGQAHADVGLPLSPVDLTLANARDRSATLPSPYRNKYEVPNVQIDSPVGLYNCPQQRTSQAFSSMDDLDALATNHHNPIHHLHPNYPPQPMNSVMSSPTTSSPHRQGRGPSQAYLNHHLMNHRHILNQAQAVISHADAACSAAIISQQPSTTSLSFKANSLERSSSNANSVASRQKKFISNMSNSAATRELPALPVSSSNQENAPSTTKMADASSRSMEDLDALEMLGVHGRSKMHYREIINDNGTSNLTNGTTFDGLSASRISSASCSGMPSSSHSHNLPNTEEYPTHHSSTCNSSGGATTMTPSISHRSSVSSIASAANLHGHPGVPRGYAAISAAAHAVLDQSHQHHSHPQHAAHQHGHHHRDAGGPYPALSHRNSTLLPGQTYPEPSLAKPNHAMGTLQEVFYHREMRLAAAVAANLSPPISSTDHTINHPRASLPSNNTTSSRKDVLQSAPPPPPKQNSHQHKISSQGGSSNLKEESPPPLFPKQYHQVVEQRRRSGLDRPTATAVPPKPTPPIAGNNTDRDQSPAIDRKSKPSAVSNPGANSYSTCNVSTGNATENSQSQTSTSTLTSSITAGSSITSLQSLDNTLISQNSSSSDCANNNIHGNQGLQPKYVPYKETTKPFEMSDFYKYSTKFRKTSASSLPQSDSSGGADESSPRSSTASENSPPELPLRPNALNSGKSIHNIGVPQGPENGNVKSQIPPPPPPKTAIEVKRSSMSSNSSGSTLAATVVGSNSNDANSLADAFSTEMLDWYNTQSNSSRSRGASIMKPMNNTSIQPKGAQSGLIETKNSKDSTSNKPATLV